MLRNNIRAGIRSYIYLLVYMVHVLQPQLAGDSWSSEENPRELCQEEALQSRYQGWNQYYASGPGLGSKRFWAVFQIRIRIHPIHMFLGLPDPDPLIRSMDPDPDPSIILLSSKIVRKTLISTVLWLFLDFLSLKNDVNVPSKSNKQKTFFLN